MRSFNVIFKRKKKKLENFNALGLINDIALPLTLFGEKITNLDVVLICIDRIASQCAKLKGRCIKRSKDESLLRTIVTLIIDYITLTMYKLDYESVVK